MIYNK